MSTTIYDRLREIVKESGMSDTQFGREFDVNQGSISNYLTGRNKLPIEFVQKVLEKYDNISAEWLLLGKGEMHYSVKNNVNADNSIVADNNHGSVTQNNGVDAGSSSVMVALKMFFRAMSTCGTDQEKVALMEELKGLVDTKK